MKPRAYLDETTRYLLPLRKQLMEAWQLNHTPADVVVWHYTDATGLIKIVESGKLRATNALYLNDSMEVNYGRTLIGEEVLKKKGLLPDPADEFLDFVLAGLRITDYVHQPYVTCFSGEKARDLLSQWRAYGDGGAGYALGFTPQKLADLSPVCWLRKVVYDETIQRKLIETAIDGHCRDLVSVAPSFGGKTARLHEAVRDFSHSISEILHEYMCCFKHDSWQEEQEWRLVQLIVPFKAASGVPDAGELQFRQSRSGVVIPFTDLDIAEEDPNDSIRRMALSEIIVGPKLPAISSNNSVRQMLRRHDYEDILRITHSGITLV